MTPATSARLLCPPPKPKPDPKPNPKPNPKQVRHDPSLYHIYTNGLMSGAIDRIDEVASTACNHM